MATLPAMAAIETEGLVKVYRSRSDDDVFLSLTRHAAEELGDDEDDEPDEELAA